MPKETLKRYKLKSSKNSLKNHEKHDSDEDIKELINNNDISLQSEIDINQMGGAGTTTGLGVTPTKQASTDCGGYTNITDVINSLKDIRRVIFFRLLTEYAEYTKKPGFFSKTFTWSGLKYKKATEKMKKIQEFAECVDEGSISETNAEITEDILKSIKKTKHQQSVILGLTYVYCKSIGKETSSIISLIDSILELNASLKKIKEQKKSGTVTTDPSGKQIDFKIEKSRAYRKFIFEIPIKLFKDNKEYMTGVGVKLEELTNYHAIMKFMFNRILDRTKILLRLRRQDLQEKERREEEIQAEKKEIERIQAKVPNPEKRQQITDLENVVSILRSEMKQINDRSTELTNNYADDKLAKLDKTAKMDAIAECNDLLDRIAKFFATFNGLRQEAKDKLVTENQNATVNKNSIIKLRNAIIAAGDLKALPTDLTQPSNIAGIEASQTPLFTTNIILRIAPFFDMLKPEVVAQLAPELFRDFNATVINKMTYAQVNVMSKAQIDALIDFLVRSRDDTRTRLDDKGIALLNLIIKLPAKFMSGGGLIQTGGAVSISGNKYLIETFMELLKSIKKYDNHPINVYIARAINFLTSDPSKRNIFDDSAIKIEITEKTNDLSGTVTAFLDTSTTITTYADAYTVALRLTRRKKLNAGLLQQLIEFINGHADTGADTKAKLLECFRPDVIANITPDQLNFFTAETFKLFDGTQLQALNQPQIEGIKFDLLSDLGEKIQYLNDQFLSFGGNITTVNLRTLTDDTINNLTEEQIINLCNSSLAVTGLNNKIERLSVIVNRLPDNLFAKIPPGSIQFIDLNMLESEQFRKFTAAQVNGLTLPQMQNFYREINTIYGGLSDADKNVFTDAVTSHIRPTTASLDQLFDKTMIIIAKINKIQHPLTIAIINEIPNIVFSKLGYQFLLSMNDANINGLSEPKVKRFLKVNTITNTALAAIPTPAGVTTLELMNNIGKQIAGIMIRGLNFAHGTPPETIPQLIAAYINRSCQNDITAPVATTGSTGTVLADAVVANVLVGIFEKLAENPALASHIIRSLIEVFAPASTDNNINNFVNSNNALGNAFGKFIFATGNDTPGPDPIKLQLLVGLINMVCNLVPTGAGVGAGTIVFDDKSREFISGLFTNLGDKDFTFVRQLINNMIVVNPGTPGTPDTIAFIFPNIMNIINVGDADFYLSIQSFLLTLNDPTADNNDAINLIRIINYLCNGLDEPANNKNKILEFIGQILDSMAPATGTLHQHLIHELVYTDVLSDDNIQRLANTSEDFGKLLGKFMLKGTDPSSGTELGMFVNLIGNIPDDAQTINFLKGLMSVIPADDDGTSNKASNFTYYIVGDAAVTPRIVGSIAKIATCGNAFSESIVDLIIKTNSPNLGYYPCQIINLACDVGVLSDNANKNQRAFVIGLINNLADKAEQALIRDLFTTLASNEFTKIVNFAQSDVGLGAAVAKLIIKGILGVVIVNPDAGHAGGGSVGNIMQKGGSNGAPAFAGAAAVGNVLALLQAAPVHQQAPLAPAVVPAVTQAVTKAAAPVVPAPVVQAPAPVVQAAAPVVPAVTPAGGPPAAAAAAAPTITIVDEVALPVVNFIIRAANLTTAATTINAAAAAAADLPPVSDFLNSLFGKLYSKEFYPGDKNENRAAVAVRLLDAFATAPAPPILSPEAQAELLAIPGFHFHFAALIYAAGETEAQQGFIKYAAIAAIARNIDDANIELLNTNILEAIAHDIGIKNNAAPAVGGFAKCFCKIRAPTAAVPVAPSALIDPAFAGVFNLPADANDSNIAQLGDANQVVGDALRLINAMKYYTEVCRLPINVGPARISKNDADANIQLIIASITNFANSSANYDVVSGIVRSAILPDNNPNADTGAQRFLQVLNKLYKIKVPTADLATPIGNEQKDALMQMIIMLYLEIESAYIGSNVPQINAVAGVTAPSIGAVNIPTRTRRIDLEAIYYVNDDAVVDKLDYLRNILGDDNTSSLEISRIVNAIFAVRDRQDVANIQAFPEQDYSNAVAAMLSAVFAASTHIDKVYAACFDATAVSPVDPTNATPATKAFAFPNWQDATNPNNHGPILRFIQTLHNAVPRNPDLLQFANDIISVIADISLDPATLNEGEQTYLDNGLFLAGGSKQSKPIIRMRMNIPRPLKNASKSAHVHLHTRKRNIRLSGKNRKHTKKNLNRNKTQKHKKPQRKATKTRF